MRTMLTKIAPILPTANEPARRVFRSSANLGYHGIAVAFTAAVATGECRQLGNL
jgi:hypothetical protein